MIKTVPVQEAVGMVLCHDMTRIVPGQSKGPAFRKGHIIGPEDIPTLLSIGKERVYAMSLEAGQVHEDEAAMRIARAVAGPGLTASAVCEGRVNLKADTGLLKVDVEALRRVNSVPEVVVATVHNNTYIGKPRDVAGTRVVPLIIDEASLKAVEAICAETGPVIRSVPLARFRVGLVTTGSEVFHGRIEDKFGPVVRRKIAELGSEVMEQKLVSDDPAMTREAIESFLARGADMVLVTGGMSVDPDDQTPASIRATGAEIVTYGAPTFPGVMFMVAYKDGTPILGLPGCVMYYRASVFDLIVPRILAGERIARQDIIDMGHGGFCAGCETCRFPICPFGK